MIKHIIKILVILFLGVLLILPNGYISFNRKSNYEIFEVPREYYKFPKILVIKDNKKSDIVIYTSNYKYKQFKNIDKLKYIKGKIKKENGSIEDDVRLIIYKNNKYYIFSLNIEDKVEYSKYEYERLKNKYKNSNFIYPSIDEFQTPLEFYNNYKSLFVPFYLEKFKNIYKI